MPHSTIQFSRSSLVLPIAFILALACLLAAAAQEPPAPTTSTSTTSPDYDRWYIIEIQNQHAGWMHELQTTNSHSGNITTTQKQHITIRRDRALVEMRLEGKFTESKTHQPISLRTLEQLGTTPNETTYHFNNQNISIQRNHEPTETRPLITTPFLTPAQARATLIQNLQNPTLDTFNLTTLDPLSGITPITLIYTITNRNLPTQTPQHQTINATQWTLTQKDQPDLAATELIDPTNARLLHSTSTFAAYEMTYILSTKQIATRPGKAPELLTTTFIKPNRTIRNPRGTKRATYQLITNDNKLPDLPTTGSQTIQVNEADPTSINVTIDTTRFHPATPAELDNRAQFLKSSPYINADAAEVRALLTRAIKKKRNELPPAQDPAVAQRHAESLRAFTFRYIKSKDLGVGFASAQEVAKTKQGDCTEHAVLLAALLRADGIPARIASGLIYAKSFAGSRHVFVYHMWTQALINNQWVDLDATLRSKPFDATHITIQTTDLNHDSITNTLATTATLFGRLKIKIVTTEYK